MTTAAILLQSGGGFGSFPVVLLLMFAIMYLIVILPQQRHRKKTQAMLSALKTGDKIITGSGIYGTISGLDGESVILKISSEPQVKSFSVFIFSSAIRRSPLPSPR